jgi:hypothetical protein
MNPAPHTLLSRVDLGAQSGEDIGGSQRFARPTQVYHEYEIGRANCSRSLHYIASLVSACNKGGARKIEKIGPRGGAVKTAIISNFALLIGDIHYDSFKQKDGRGFYRRPVRGSLTLSANCPCSYSWVCFKAALLSRERWQEPCHFVQIDGLGPEVRPL